MCLLSIGGLLVISACSETGARKDTIRWGADEAGGAPFEFRDPKDPSKRVGFEVEISDEIGRRTGKKIEFVQAQWDTLIPALKRGDFDMAMSGIEITDERKAEADFTQPYYVYTQQLVVRAEQTSVTTLEDLKGRAVGTLAACAAERVLQNTPGIEVKSYDDNVRPYDDLAIGRIDGVLLDLCIASYYAKPNTKLRFAGEPFAPGHYGIAVRKEDVELRRQIDDALSGMKKDGTLERIYRKWELWNDAQAPIFKPF
ncbi:MAG: ABC transporter substrate-binding protein [Candidatus Sumerlaeaceae bacterium]